MLTSLGICCNVFQKFLVEFYRSVDQEAGGGGKGAVRVQLVPESQPSDISGLARLVTHGLRTEGGLLAGLQNEEMLCEEASCRCEAPLSSCKGQVPLTTCRCEAHMAKFRACLLRLGILASDVVRILTSLVLLQRLDFVAAGNARGRTTDRNTGLAEDGLGGEEEEASEGETVVVAVAAGVPDLLTSLAGSLGVEATVLEAGLLWEVPNVKQVRVQIHL